MKTPKPTFRPNTQSIPSDVEASALVPNPVVVPGARITARDSGGAVQDGWDTYQVKHVTFHKRDFRERQVMPGMIVEVVSNDGWNVVVRFDDGEIFASQACQARMVPA